MDIGTQAVELVSAQELQLQSVEEWSPSCFRLRRPSQGCAPLDLM